MFKKQLRGFIAVLAISIGVVSMAHEYEIVRAAENETNEIPIIQSDNPIIEDYSDLDAMISEPTAEDLYVVESSSVEDNIIVEEDETDYVIHVVQSGDSFWKISNDYYGDGRLYTELAQANNMSVSTVIHPGEEIIIYDNISEIEFKEAQEYIPTTIVEEEKEETETITQSNNIDTSNMTYVGNYRITGYDPYCSHCCGKTNGITASGRPAEIGYSVGCNDLPLGTKLYIEGYGYYRVDDNGGGGGGLIDIACESHDACYKVTNRNIPIYIINE